MFLCERCVQGPVNLIKHLSGGKVNVNIKQSVFSVTNRRDKESGRAGYSGQSCVADKGLAVPFTLLQPYRHVDRLRVMNKSKASLLIN